MPEAAHGLAAELFCSKYPDRAYAAPRVGQAGGRYGTNL